MATRAYRRNSRGQFAGSGGRVTYGKAGGFANAAHRANVNNARSARAQQAAMTKQRTRQVGRALAVSAGTALAVGAVRTVARARF